MRDLLHSVMRPGFPRTAHVASALAALTLIPLLAGCSGSATGSTSAPSSPAAETPTVTILPASTSILATQPLPVVVTVSATGSGYPTPTGTVTLSGGSYTSSPIALTSGGAPFTIPASSLAAGSDTLTATYTPSGSAAADFNSAIGTAAVSVSVSAGNTPTSVTATSVTYATTGAPFEALAAPNGTVYVGVPSGIQVFSPPVGRTVGVLTATCIDQLSTTLTAESAAVSELSILPNGLNLAAGINTPGAAFYNLAALQTCTATPNVVSQGTIASDQGTQAIAVTSDGKYAFVSNEYGVASGATVEGNIGVVALQYDSSGNVLPTSTLLGQISTGGQAIAGMALSPDGTRLYVTSEIASTAAQSSASGTSNPILARTGCVQQIGGTPQINGLLSVISVAKAEASPTSSAILATVAAGCSPVRMAETANNAALWVAIRGDNRVLAFSTALLESNPSNALLGYADTGGTAPVGIALFHSAQLLAVANSNRFNTGTANATILSVAVPAAPAVLTTIPTGLFPREITVAPDASTLYLTNYSSATLQVISTTVH